MIAQNFSTRQYCALTVAGEACWMSPRGRAPTAPTKGAGGGNASIRPSGTIGCSPANSNGRHRGTLDSSSSGDGTLAADALDSGRAVTVQPDGKLVVAGSKNADVALVRFLVAAGPPPPGADGDGVPDGVGACSAVAAATACPAIAGATVKIKVKLTKPTRVVVKRALRSGKRIRPTLAIAVTDTAGTTTNLTRLVKLR